MRAAASAASEIHVSSTTRVFQASAGLENRIPEQPWAALALTGHRLPMARIRRRCAARQPRVVLARELQTLAWPQKQICDTTVTPAQTCHRPLTDQNGEESEAINVGKAQKGVAGSSSFPMGRCKGSYFHAVCAAQDGGWRHPRCRHGTGQEKPQHRRLHGKGRVNLLFAVSTNNVHC